MNKNSNICIFFFFCLFFLITLPARAQLNGKIVYPEFYTYRAGDDTPALAAQPEFDDSDWERIKYGTFPHESWQGIGWFRYVLEVDSSLWHVPLGLKMSNIFGGAEFYLDGKLLHQFGRVVASKEEEEPYIQRGPRAISIQRPPGHTSGKSRHLVAIRYSSFFFESPIWSGGRSILRWRIGDLEQMREGRASTIREATFHQMLLTGLFLAFALLHLLLFLFYPRTRANLYYAVLTTSFALVVYFWFQSLFTTDAVHFIWHLRLRNAAMTLMMLSSIRLTYLLLYPKLPNIFIPFCLVGLGLTLWNWFRPFIIRDTHLTVFAIACVAEILRVLVASWIKKRQAQLEGSWIILLGMIPFLLVGVYYLLNLLDVVPLPWDLEDIPTPFYAMLLLMISISVFLSRNFAQTNKNLEAQLVQVKELSEKTLQQELERARLEAENVRKTKELEEARQLQLSMLPQTVPQLPSLDIAVYSKPATEVGGDYYDFHLAGDGTLTIAIGDATGHGMSAGTMVSVTKGLFQSLAHEASLPKILREMSSALASMNLGFLYMAMTLVKFKETKIKISAAGMPPALVYKATANKVDEIVLKGVPLGGFPDFKYKQEQMQLHSGDTLVLMSDGLPERFNDAGEMIDYPGAKRLVEEVAHEEPQAIIDYLVAAGDKWSNGRPQDDDVTFVVMKVQPKSRKLATKIEL